MPKEGPGGLNPGPFWLGASEEYVLKLLSAYSQMLAQVSDVPHEGLHTDNPEYDF